MASVKDRSYPSAAIMTFEAARRSFHITVRAVRLLWRFRLRSGLLMLSAGLGVAGVVCSVNYGESGAWQLLDQIQKLGTNVLVITPAQSRVIGGRARTGGSVTTLVEGDYSAIRRSVLTRTRSSAVVTGSFWIKAGDLSKNAAVMGCEPEYFAIKNWPVASGELFSALEERHAERVVVLGHTVAADLFGNESPVGRRLLVNRVPFEVIGVLTERGQGLDISNEDNQVYVPLSTAMHRLMNVDYYAAIAVEVDTLSHMDEAAEQIHSLLRQRRHPRPNEPEDFQIQNQKTLLATQLSASNRLTFFLEWIGASALVVSGLGILGISWIAVKERTREIGVRRALGATGADIFFQMLLESALLSLLGCGLGLLLAWPVSDLVAQSNKLPFVFNAKAAWIALFVAIALNLTFAVLPARKAASLNPIEALRFE
jgi:putative ABC transport system permease protein